MSDKLIEQYYIKDEGYHPFLIRDGWQVAQLNYLPEQHIDNIGKIDVHHLTDEVFILLKGNAVLIGAEIKEEDISFEVELMKPFITYNIPKNAWHNIAMEKDCEIIIVERSDTHLTDVEHIELTNEQQKELRDKVNELFRSVSSGNN